MSFKLKYKDKDGVDIELDFEEVAFTVDGNFILSGEDKNTGEMHRFIWRSIDQDPIPDDFL